MGATEMQATNPATALVLRGGLVYDGTGSEPVVQDILITNGVISAVVGRIDPPTGALVREIDGLNVLPGFIDVHSHDDAALFRPRALEPKLRQGVTTTVIGNCGQGCAPSAADSSLEEYSTPVLGTFPDRQWPRFADYLADVASQTRAVNSVALVPHAPMRAAVLGMVARAADRGEVDQIAGSMTEAMDAGAAGVSLGLMYSPGDAADKSELTAIAAAVAARDKLLVAHIRNEADLLLPSLNEIADLARVTGASIHISHLKVTGPRNFGRMPEIIDHLDALRASGIDVTADVYPYDAGSTTVATLFPSWATERGVHSLLAILADPPSRARVLAELRTPWRNSALENQFAAIGPDAILLAGFQLSENAGLEGQSLGAIARDGGRDSLECLADLVLAEAGALTVVLFHTDIEGMKCALAWPHTLVGSDGLPREEGYVHPRLYGTFSRLIALYTGPGAPLSLTEAVKRVSRDAAQRFGIPGKPGIIPGADADLQLVDPALYSDEASFAAPRRHPRGLDSVYVGGNLAFSAAGDPTRESGAFVPVARPSPGSSSAP